MNLVRPGAESIPDMGSEDYRGLDYSEEYQDDPENKENNIFSSAMMSK